MASEKEIERRKRILRARGVPEAFIDQIATRRDNYLHQVLMWGMGLAAAFALPALFIFDRPTLDNVLAPLLYGDPGPVWMFGVHVSYFVFLGCLWLYGTFTISGFVDYVFGRAVAPYPAYSSVAVGLRSLDVENESLETLKPNPRFQALANAGSEQAFLKAVQKPKGGRWHGSWLILLATVCLACHFDYWTLKGHTLTVHRPWGSRVYDLRHAKYAVVDCRDGEDSNQFEYGIYFPHKRFELAMRRDVVNRLAEPGVFARLERVDAFLVKAGIPVYRAERTAKSEEADGACHTVWADPLGEGGTARFDSLLYGTHSGPK